ncbi:MAG: cytochrome P450 [Pseudomonadota bacterium]
MLSQDSKTTALRGPVETVDLGVSIETLERLRAAQEEFGSIVAFNDERRGPTLFVNSAEHVNALLLRQHKQLRKGTDFERVRMLLGNGIIVNDGELWRRHRRALQPAFTRRRIAEHVVAIDAVVDRLAVEWASAAMEQATVDVNATMSRFALEIIQRAIFSDDFDQRFGRADSNPFRLLSEEFARDLRAVTRLRSARNDVQAIIEERRVSERRHIDFLDELLFGAPALDAELTDKEIVDEVMTLVVAGYETSAATLTFAWHQLATNPALADALVNELTTAGEAADDPLAWVGELPRTMAMLRETLRLYPPVWLFSRRTAEALTVLDIDIPADTNLLLSPYLLHRDPVHWTSPEDFDPDRFLAGADNPAYIPFSLGPRRCIGEFFAMLEMCRHFHRLLPMFVPALVEEPRLDLRFGINLRPGHTVTMHLDRRQGVQV